MFYVHQLVKIIYSDFVELILCDKFMVFNCFRPAGIYMYNNGLFGIAATAGLIPWIVQNKEQNVNLMSTVWHNNL